MGWIRNMQIKKRLIMVFSMVALIASISGVISIFIMSNMDKDYSTALTEYGFAQGDIGKAMIIITDSRRLVRDIVNFQKPENVQAAKAQLEEYRKLYPTYADAVEKSLVSDEAKAIYARIEKNFEAYTQMQDKFIELGTNTTQEERNELCQRMIDELDPVYQELYDSYKEIMEIKVNLGNELSLDLTRGSKLTICLVVVIVVISIIAGIIMGTLVSNGIANPIHQCVDRLNKLCHGDLKSPVPDIRRKDEAGILANATKEIIETIVTIIEDMSYSLEAIGHGDFTVKSKTPERYIGDYSRLLDSIKKIITELSATMGQINQASDQVAIGSEQVSDGSQSLSQGATEQASSIEELSSTLAELAARIKENADNADNAKGVTETVDTEIVESNSQMREMIEAMNDISDKSNEISKIIKTIDDIAFQTNILALNAAVEAARAGEAGKGFAVVADEVRNLAGKSAEAAKNTEALIAETVEAVGKGAAKADNTAKAMLTVVEGAEKIMGLVEQIAAASEEQADSVNQVNGAVEQISNVVQNNAATAEESAAASEQLSAQAQMLKQLVAKFKLRGTQDVMPEVETYTSYSQTDRETSVPTVKSTGGFTGSYDKY